MALPELIGSFSLGFFLGIGAAILYLRWKMKRQLGSLEEQMEGLMDISEEMEDAFSVEEEELEE